MEGQHISTRSRWALFAVTMTSILIGLACIAYTNWAVRNSEQVMCTLVTIKITPNPGTRPPPPGSTGDHVIKAFDNISRKYNCRG